MFDNGGLAVKEPRVNKDWSLMFKCLKRKPQLEDQ
jgi:hypothetical protein